MLGDAGLDVAVVPLDLGVMLARLDAGDFDLAMLQIPELTEPNVLSWFFHPRVPGGRAGAHRARYRSAAAARCRRGRDDRGSQCSARFTALARTMADMPVVPLWCRRSSRGRFAAPDFSERRGALAVLGEARMMLAIETLAFGPSRCNRPGRHGERTNCRVAFCAPPPPQSWPHRWRSRRPPTRTFDSAGSRHESVDLSPPAARPNLISSARVASAGMAPRSTSYLWKDAESSALRIPVAAHVTGETGCSSRAELDTFTSSFVP